MPINFSEIMTLDCQNDYQAKYITKGDIGIAAALFSAWLIYSVILLNNTLISNTCIFQQNILNR